MKIHGWNADMTTATIEAAESSSMVKENFHNGKLGLHLTESAVDQEYHNDTESSSQYHGLFRRQKVLGHACMTSVKRRVEDPLKKRPFLDDLEVQGKVHLRI